MDLIGNEHAAVYKKYRENPPTIVIQRIIQFLKEKYSGPLQNAVDLGCGSGQCTFELCKYFDQVLGTDISPTQISEAVRTQLEKKIDNVAFKTSPAEDIELPDKSVQLILACRSAHWFDLKKVYKEGERVLCLGGVMAFIGTKALSLVLEYLEDDNKNVEISKIADYIHEFLTPYFPSAAKAAMDEYKDIEIPCNEFQREHGYLQETTVSLAYIMGLIESYSMFQNFCKLKGKDEGQQFLGNVRNTFLRVTGLRDKDVNQRCFNLKTTYFLVMGRF